MWVERVDHIIWGAELWAHTLFLLPMRASASLGRSGKCRRLPPYITCRNYVNRLGTWNVREINRIVKGEKVVDVFRKRKCELFGLVDSKLKGNREVSWCGENGIIAGVQEMERAREGVAVLLNDVWRSAVVDFGCISSRILWIKLKFSRVKVCVVVRYNPSEGDSEERNRFWNNMNRILDGVGNGYRLCFLGDRMRAGITGAFGIPGENDNGRRVVEF